MDLFSIQSNFKLVFLLCIGLRLHVASSSRVRLETEEAIFEDYRIASRSKASGGKTLHLYKNETLYVEFCLTSQTPVLISNVRYSNDGDADTVNVGLDRQSIGTFSGKAVPSHGRGWNTFQSTGPLSSLIMIDEGRHRISLTVIEADKHGIEIDYVELDIHNNQTETSVKCQVFCFDHIHYDDDMPYNSIGTGMGHIEQKSKRTRCAEEDNIQIPVFHKSAKRFVVSASLPKYPSFANNRLPDFTNCKMADNIWKFEYIQFFAFVKDSVTRVAGDAFLHGENHQLTTYIEISFSLDGEEALSTEADTGSIVALQLEHLTVNTSALLTYKGRNGTWSSPATVELGPNQPRANWSIPDFTWREGSGNKVRVAFRKSDAGDIIVKYVKMFRRPLRPDKYKIVFNDGMVVVDAVEMDLWWKINQSMTLMVSGSETFHSNIHYIRIYQRIPWSKDAFSQTFVIYQDGYVRLLPPSPHGLDWVPFGSSFLLGQSNASSTRPSASIKHIHLNPRTLDMNVIYEDGGTTSFQIKTTLTETNMIISNSIYTQALDIFPFLTFRSMWLADGNADVDHVTTDGKQTESILGDWNSIEGNFFAFYRKCISKHNTQSPDLRLKIIA